jgi:hypothetical protein
MAPMVEFVLSVKGEGVTMTPQQAMAVTQFGTETGGTIEVHATDSKAVLVFGPGGQQVVFQPDGTAVRVK